MDGRMFEDTDKAIGCCVIGVAFVFTMLGAAIATGVYFALRSWGIL